MSSGQLSVSPVAHRPALALTRAWSAPVAAIGSGLLLALASPPLDWWPLALVGLIPLVAALRGAGARRALWLGWLTGFALALAGCQWLWDMDRFTLLPAALRPLGAVALAAVEGLTLALAAGSGTWLCNRWQVRPLLVYPLSFALAEIALPSPFFPHYLGGALWRVWPAVQAAELGGPAAVTALLVLCNLLMWEGAPLLRRRRLPDLGLRIGAAIVLLALLGGYVRGSYVAAVRQRAPRLQVGMVQPNPVSFTDMSGKDLRTYMQTLASTTSVLFARGANLVVWTETAWPVVEERRPVGAPAPPFLRMLVTGVAGRLLVGSFTRAGGVLLHNSALLLGSGGSVAGQYDKTRLVPLFEYVPSFVRQLPLLADWLIRQLPARPALQAAAEPSIVTDGALRLGVMICVEELYAQSAAQLARQRPNLLVGISSNGWLDRRGTPAQQLAFAAFRAVEARRDLVHVADGGLSATVDALGRVQVRGPLPVSAWPDPVTATSGEVALVDAFSLAPYTIPWFPLGCLAVLAAAVIWRRRGQAPDH